MHYTVRRKHYPHERGQALTEFLIAASFVLVPMFIFIPMLGKYIDFKHATIQAARYQAWEYTVWFERPSNHDLVKNYNNGIGGFQLPSKGVAATRAESLARVMSNVGNENARSTGAQPAAPISPILESDKTDTYQARWSWVDHNNNAFFGGALSNVAADSDAATPTLNLFGIPIGTIVNGVFDVLGMAFDALGSLVRATGTAAGFTAINMDGYSKVSFDAVALRAAPGAAVRTRLNNQADFSTIPLTFSAKAAVLADGWNAGGTIHTQEQVAGVTPATLVRAFANLPGLRDVLTVAGWIMPEFSLCKPAAPPLQLFDPSASPDGHMWLGYVDSDVIHPDRLSEPGTPDQRLGDHVCDEAGICDWDAGVKSLPVPLSHADCIP